MSINETPCSSHDAAYFSLHPRNRKNSFAIKIPLSGHSVNHSICTVQSSALNDSCWQLTIPFEGATEDDLRIFDVHLVELESTISKMIGVLRNNGA